MDCKEFFKELDNLPGNERGDFLRKQTHAQLMKWQSESASDFSPGVVHGDEQLRLSLYDGVQIADGKLSRLAFRALDQLGLSTDRCLYAELAESHLRARRKAQRDEKRAWGWVELSTKELRSMKVPLTETEAVGVYDTAVRPLGREVGNRAHAEAFLIYKSSNKMPLKSIHADLMDLYKDRLNQWPAD